MSSLVKHSCPIHLARSQSVSFPCRRSQVRGLGDFFLCKSFACVHIYYVMLMNLPRQSVAVNLKWPLILSLILSLFLICYIYRILKRTSPFYIRFSFYGERVFARKAASSTIGAHICLFLWHVDHLTHWSGEGFTISVRLLHSFKRRWFLYVKSST